MGQARGQPPEDERNGTAKRLTLFHPASGRVRAKGVTSAVPVAAAPGLGSPGGPPHPRAGDLALAARGAPLVYSFAWQLAQPGGVPTAHPGAPGALRPASADTPAAHHLVGGDGGRMERGTHALYRARQALGTAPTGARAASPAPGGLEGDLRLSIFNCQMTHYLAEDDGRRVQRRSRQRAHAHWPALPRAHGRAAAWRVTMARLLPPRRGSEPPNRCREIEEFSRGGTTTHDVRRADFPS